MEGSIIGQVRHGSGKIPLTGRRFGKAKSAERGARSQSGNTAIHWLAGYCEAMSREAQASIAELSRELGINAKTVAKWRKRKTVEDRKTGPKEPRSTVLSEEEEAMVVAFRRHTLLPPDDCLYALQPSSPHLTRSSLHRCLQRHGISRLPDMDGDKPKRQKFKRYPIGYFHIHCPAVHIYMHERGHCRAPDRRRQALSLCCH